MDGGRKPTPFGWYLLNQMAACEPPMKQAELANAMGVSQSTVSRWIYETENPGPDLLRKAAAALGTNYADLLTTVGYVDHATPATQAGGEPDPDVIDEIRQAWRYASDAERATLEPVLRAVVAPYLDRHRPARRRRIG